MKAKPREFRIVQERYGGLDWFTVQCRSGGILGRLLGWETLSELRRSSICGAPPFRMPVLFGDMDRAKAGLARWRADLEFKDRGTVVVSSDHLERARQANAAASDRMRELLRGNDAVPETFAPRADAFSKAMEDFAAPQNDHPRPAPWPPRDHP